jgi:hypothetical protein
MSIVDKVLEHYWLFNLELDNTPDRQGLIQNEIENFAQSAIEHEAESSKREDIQIWLRTELGDNLFPKLIEILNSQVNVKFLPQQIAKTIVKEELVSKLAELANCSDFGNAIETLDQIIEQIEETKCQLSGVIKQTEDLTAMREDFIQQPH